MRVSANQSGIIRGVVLRIACRTGDYLVCGTREARREKLNKPPVLQAMFCIKATPLDNIFIW